jgi:hypothetical protein
MPINVAQQVPTINIVCNPRGDVNSDHIILKAFLMTVPLKLKSQVGSRRYWTYAHFLKDIIATKRVKVNLL